MFRAWPPWQLAAGKRGQAGRLSYEGVVQARRLHLSYEGATPAPPSCPGPDQPAQKKVKKFFSTPLTVSVVYL
ncbi:MAG: hypothetical protein KME26_02840 [Oscillatoria princeps RMCB-10]|nr:hypothetical protein [Oscillatoria princeps RMCB-10]